MFTNISLIYDLLNNKVNLNIRIYIHYRIFNWDSVNKDHLRLWKKLS